MRKEILQVAYQILHDDDNQQVLEIQYHHVLEVEEATDPAAETTEVQCTSAETSDQPDSQQNQVITLPCSFPCVC